MILAYMIKLDLASQITNIKTKIINNSILKVYNMTLTIFSPQDNLIKV